MSKISNLDLVLDEMITAGQKMIEAATVLKEIFSEEETDYFLSLFLSHFNSSNTITKI